MAGRPSTSARRYADAVFSLAIRDGTEDAWRHALRAAAEGLGQEDVLRIVENPARPHAERMSVVRAALSGQALASLVRVLGERDRSTDGRLDALVDVIRSKVVGRLVNLVGLLVDRRAVSQLPAIADEYERLLDAERGIVRALVTSATPLTEDEAAALRVHVGEMTGSRIELRRSVDSALLGGLTVRVGDRLVDASVRGRLERLHHQLMADNRQPHGTGA